MTDRNHDHPGSPDAGDPDGAVAGNDAADGTHGIDPADLDLYALDALPGPETDALEEALVNAPEDQRASMLAHIAATREVAADMVAGAGLDASPPPALRAKVLDEVATYARREAAGRPGKFDDDDNTADPAPGDRSDGDGSVVDLSSARANRGRRTWAVIGSAAAAVLLVAAGVAIGWLAGGSSSEDNLPVATPTSTAPPTDSPSAPSMPEGVAQLLASDDLEISRGPVGSAGAATVLASQSADMAVISMTGLPEPDAGRAYQLWLMGDHDPIPAGTMEAGQVGPSPAAMISDIRGSAQIGITNEPAGGSPAPTGDVLAALDLT